VTEVVAQVQFGGAQAKVNQGGQFQLSVGSAHFRRRIVHGVGDDHAAAVVPADQGDQMLWMIAHPK
jgi:hypothetical protein